MVEPSSRTVFTRLLTELVDVDFRVPAPHRATNCSGRSDLNGSTAQSRGFTLIELMIVIVVLAVLAAIAYPSYVTFVTRSDRSDAREALAQVQLAQERFRGRNGRYAVDFGELGLAASGAEAIDSPRELYRIRIPASDRSSFTVSAQAQGTQLRDALACRGQTDPTRIRVEVTPAGERRLPENCW